MRRIDDKFLFRNSMGFNTICDIFILGDVVICSETEENTGASVTNCCEGLVESVCSYYGLDTTRTIWLERNGGIALVSIIDGVASWSHISEEFAVLITEMQALPSGYENYSLYKYM